METTMLRLHDLVNETMRVMRFIDRPIPVRGFFDKTSKLLDKLDLADARYMNGLIIRYTITESEYIPNGVDIDDIKRLQAIDIFDNKRCYVEDFCKKHVLAVSGKALILSRRIGFVEVDITGFRRKMMFDRNDINTILKDPIKRDIVYVTKMYDNIIDDVLLAIRHSIERAILYNHKTHQILTRLIDYIKEHPLDKKEG